VSKSSPERGGARPRAADAGGALAVELEHARLRHLGWMVAGLVLGALMVWKLGTVGRWLGVALALYGAYSGYAVARTLRHPAGTLRVGDDTVELPRGLCAGAPVVVPTAQVEHAYLLRRAVPWTWAAPVLVIEAQGQAFTYPRDWFLSEADQRRVVRALHARAVDPAPPTGADEETSGAAAGPAAGAAAGAADGPAAAPVDADSPPP
jgi:hypothetical protein